MEKLIGYSSKDMVGQSFLIERLEELFANCALADRTAPLILWC